MANHTWKWNGEEILTQKGGKITWGNERFFTLEVHDTKFHGELITSDTERGTLHVKLNHRIFEVSRYRPIDAIVGRLGMDKITDKSLTVLKSPMPGKIVAITVEVGQTISKGDSLLTLEAMKMENVLKAEGSGVVKTISTATGAIVEKDAILIEFE